MPFLPKLVQPAARKSALGLLLVALVLTSCANSVKAADQPSADLEKQVLEIIRNHPEVILESVDQYQREQQAKQAKARAAIINQITSQPAAVIGNSPTLGQGKTILIEFSDFQCPFCARAHENIKQFMQQRSGEVTLVYKYLPLSQIHPEAISAAQAAWAAQQQGKFWEFHNALFENQDQLGTELYQATAKKLGLDLTKFDRDRRSKAAQTAIENDLELANSLDLRGTPTFLMNGQLFSGAVSVEELEQRLAQP
jgi:protein-disulfide isomerase